MGLIARAARLATPTHSGVVRRHVARGPLLRSDPGTAPLTVRDLLTSERLDVWVRRDVVRLLDELADAPDTVIHDVCRGHPYRVWFRDVHCRRFAPRLLRDAPAFDRAYRARVDATRRLLASVGTSGVRSDQPIVVRTATFVATSGARSAPSLFPGDGCHRLAILLHRGVDAVPADQYVRHHHLWYRPPDNTAVLLASGDPEVRRLRSEFEDYLGR